MYTPTTPAAYPQTNGGEQVMLGTPLIPFHIAWGAMCACEAFAEDLDDTADPAGRPADDLAAGVAVFPRGRANQAMIRVAVQGSGAVTTRVHRVKPNADGSAWHKTLLYVAVWQADAGGRAVPAAMLNGAEDARYAAGLSVVSHHPLDPDGDNACVTDAHHPAYLIVDTLGGDLLVECAGDSVSGFNVIVEWI